MTSEEILSKKIIKQFWATMETNDFQAAAQLLHDEYILEWPQSGERIRGRANFAAVNERYPAAGKWRFTVRRVIAEGDEAVTEVIVTDGSITATALTFSTIRDGRIIKQVEYWPDPFEAQEWRAQWVEKGNRSSK